MIQNSSTSPFAARSHAALDARQARFGLWVSAALTERAGELGPDVTERLRFARQKALERARAGQATPVVGVTRSGAALLGQVGAGWWIRLASVLPVVALVGGLVLIDRWQDNDQIAVAAEVDAALLADDLPPTAYRDAGFAEFLKSPGE